MHIRLIGAAAAFVLMTAAPAPGQQLMTIDGDDVTIRGCVTRATPQLGAALVPEMLIWTRGDVMLSALLGAGGAPVGTAGLASRVFYWLDDDDRLERHIGQLVEIRGELEDVETGEIEFDRDGDFTEIELDFNGREEKARVPTAWLGPGAPERDTEFNIVVRKIDVDDVRIIDACPR